MEHGKWYVAFGIGLVVLCLAGSAYFLRAARISSTMTKPVPVAVQPARPSNLTGLSIYTNGEYGFSVFYPGKDLLTEGLSDAAALPDGWRLGASATGTPILSIIDSNDGAPLALVRVGISSNKQEVKNCLKAGPGEEKAADAHLGGTLFKTFSFDRTGTDNELLVQSYRAVHDGSCVAIESFHSPQVASSTDLDGIVQSFSFARP